MYFIPQKMTPPDSEIKHAKQAQRKLTGVKIHMCNVCVSAAFFNMNALFFHSLPFFCFGFLFPSCKSLVKVLLWQVKINRSHRYWKPCGTEGKGRSGVVGGSVILYLFNNTPNPRRVKGHAQHTLPEILQLASDHSMETRFTCEGGFL